MSKLKQVERLCLRKQIMGDTDFSGMSSLTTLVSEVCWWERMQDDQCSLLRLSDAAALVHIDLDSLGVEEATALSKCQGLRQITARVAAGSTRQGEVTLRLLRPDIEWIDAK